MRPIPVPEQYMYDGLRRITLGAPRGMEDTVRPLELCRDDSNNEWWVLVEFDEEDKKLGKAWIVIHGGIFQPIATAKGYSKEELTSETRNTPG